MKKGTKVKYQHTKTGKTIKGKFLMTYECHGNDYHLIELPNGKRCSTKKGTKFTK